MIQKEIQILKNQIKRDQESISNILKDITQTEKELEKKEDPFLRKQIIHDYQSILYRLKLSEQSRKEIQELEKS